MPGGAPLKAPPLAPAARDKGRWHRGWSTVTCVASGPSFNEEQAELIEHARRQELTRVIAVNDNWRRLPSSDVLYACDGKWWKEHGEAVRAQYRGEMWTQDEKMAPALGLQHVLNVNAPGLTTTPHQIHSGGNSGYQAVNLAYLFGARRILLVGYDMQMTGGAQHWFGPHPKTLSMVHPYSAWLKRFAVLADDLSTVGVTVLNCTRETAMRCFAREDLRRALFHYGAPA